MTSLNRPVIVVGMIMGCRVEGYAIVSTEGMIANAEGVMPDAIRNDADQRFLQSELDRAAVIVHGRHSFEGGPRAAKRKRIIVTRRVPSVSDDPVHPHAVLWNPAGTALDAALTRLGVADGLIAILGGTQVFDLFLPRYDAFHLTRALAAKIPAGRPVFSELGAGKTPEDVLAGAGLKPGQRQNLDAGAAITLTTWTRGEASTAP
jgi:dihydrofolate reductase